MKGQIVPAKNQFLVLLIFAITLKILSVLSIALGFALEGLIIYGWGRLTAFYDVIRTAWKTLADAFSTLGGNYGTAPPVVELPQILVWPLLVILLLVFVGMVFLALTLWAGGQWVDMRLTLAEEEREARVMQAKALIAMTRDIASIASYFSSLPPPRSKA